METKKITKAKPYNYAELLSNPYNVQNMLLSQHNFPAEFHTYDEICSVYQDRSFDKWKEACDWLKEQLGESYMDFPSVSTELMMEFTKIFLSRWLESIGRELTGYRLMRYTNVASGYPCLLVLGYSHNPNNPKVELYSGQNAPNVIGYGIKDIRMVNGNIIIDEFDDDL